MLSVALTDPVSLEVGVLIRELDAELWVRYPAGPIHVIDIGAFKAAGGVFMVAREMGQAVGCGAYRRYDESTVEIKRMFTRPIARGKGCSRLVLRALEQHARERGFTRVILETGDQQPEAIGLYESSGYKRVPKFGEYTDSSYSICFEKTLAERDGRVATDIEGHHAR